MDVLPDRFDGRLPHEHGVGLCRWPAVGSRSHLGRGVATSKTARGARTHTCSALLAGPGRGPAPARAHSEHPHRIGAGFRAVAIGSGYATARTMEGCPWT